MPLKRNLMAVAARAPSKFYYFEKTKIQQKKKRWKIIPFFFIFQVQNDASQPTISRSSAVAPGGRYTPLSALASLQPGGPGAQTPQGGSRFQTPSTYQHPFAPHQGKRLDPKWVAKLIVASESHVHAIIDTSFNLNGVSGFTAWLTWLAI